MYQPTEYSKELTWASLTAGTSRTLFSIFNALVGFKTAIDCVLLMTFPSD